MDAGTPQIVILRDEHATAAAAAERIASTVGAAVAARGLAHWATTGGSAPATIYRSIMDTGLRSSIPWERLHVWWGDDRFVPHDHPLSNVKAFNDVLLEIGGAEEGTAGGGPAGVPIPVDQIHPFPTTEAIARATGPDWCADALAATLRGAGLPEVDGWPSFDLLMLGIGGDGHLLSVFPGSPAIGSPRLALGIPAPTHVEPHVPRVTLNPAVIAAAREVLLVINGASKAAVVADILQGPLDPTRLPAQLARTTNATWILDEAAAAGLTR